MHILISASQGHHRNFLSMPLLQDTNKLGCLQRALFSLFCITYAAIKLICTKVVKTRSKSSDGKVTNVTPVSLLEVKVTLPTKLIFEDQAITKKYDPSELAQLPKTMLGEGTVGSLFKVILNCGSIVTIRMIREGFVKPNDLESWINFFGGIRDGWLLPLQFSFWYGGEAFIVYEYLCLGSLEELLHGTEGIQFTALSWEVRKHIALCAAMAIAYLHNQVTKTGNNVVCGVVKASNILIRTDCSACLSGYETPYLVPPATIIRRNPGRVAPELRSSNQNYPKMFTSKSDVYSFGILLLELITGKRPTVTNLAEYLIEKIKKKEGLRSICDSKMEEAKESMKEMIGIAQNCLSYDPKDRPSMDRVVQMLQQLKE
ncbi:probable inactive receptor kinase At1g48480 [Ricinus communis]|uniref:probable inactive receptor kinase At1g48480 n=1 Tax=Ricinus communis TaxID=3988 RepID=UPI00201A6219|nr:probable inactive receptor kinase At1g48480 [Ricinus communis]